MGPVVRSLTQLYGRRGWICLAAFAAVILLGRIEFRLMVPNLHISFIRNHSFRNLISPAKNVCWSSYSARWLPLGQSR